MTQMRKFEQEAIATEIYEKIKVAQGTEQIELTKTKEYKELQSFINKIQTIETKKDKLVKEISELNDTLNTGVKEFNNNILDKNFNLSTTGRYYNNVSKLVWQDDEWKVKQNIERKLAIALISPDWKDKLSTIIDDIASQFGA